MRLARLGRHGFRPPGHLQELGDEVAQLARVAEDHQRRGLALDRLQRLQRLRVLPAEERKAVFGHINYCAMPVRSPIGRTTPARTTYCTLRKFATSADRSAPRITRSASFPFSIVPVAASMPITFAALAVDATMTCIGVMPAACMESISA